VDIAPNAWLADDAAHKPERESTLRKSAKRAPAYGRGTGVPDPVDVFVGRRIRTRRLLLDMNQQQLARALGVTFQQVQKYESGANRVSASRLWEIAAVLNMPIAYFFPEEGEGQGSDQHDHPESIELVRLFYAIADSRIRQQLLDMVRVSASRDDAPRRRRT
jgi:transcriptional regulator with XRE-family HTH domain